MLLALTAAVAYAVWSAVGNDTVRHFSPGPLAKVHAMWDQQCEVCHSSFVPTNSTAWTGDPHASDKLCEACHKVPDHAANQIAAEVEGCAACHTDHHGRNADLLSVANSKCTACHSNIAEHLDAKAKSANLGLQNVTSFITDHPDFKLRSPRKDPGALKFSHAWHLLPGLPFGKGPYKLSDLSQEDRDRYRKPGQTDEDLITLDCSACHQLSRSAGLPRGAANGADVGQISAAGPVHAAGDYMLPISYELHCRACHPLSYSGSTEPTVAKPSAGETERLAAKPSETAPHGWTDPQLRKYLEQVLAGQLVHHSDANVLGQPLPYAVKNQPPPNSPLPNRTAQQHPQAKTIGDYLQAELNDRVAVLRNQCQVCHVGKTTDGLAVEPVSIANRWLEEAKFNHTAHRSMECEKCHSFDFPKSLPADPIVIQASDSAAKLIPHREICLECHRPVEGSGATAKGGDRFDCIECHRYHEGEEHGAGVPAAAGNSGQSSRMDRSPQGSGERVEG